MLLLLYSSQLPPLGPACTSTIQVPDILSHWVGLGGGGRHRWGNTEVPFSMNGSCTDLTHPSFLKVLRTSSFYLLISFYSQHSLFLISSFGHTALPVPHATCPHATADSLGIHRALHFEWPLPLYNWTYFCYQANGFCQTHFLCDRQLEEGSQFSAGSCCAVA